MITRRTKYFMYGLLAGSAAGAITALLYAPMKGDKLRAEIKRKSSQVVEDAHDLYAKASNKIAGALSFVPKNGGRDLKSARKTGDTAVKRASNVTHG